MAPNSFFNFRIFKSKKPKEHPATFSCRIQSHAQIRKIFSRFDIDGDGKISSTELETMLCSFEDYPTISDAAAEAAAIMQAVDADGDGSIQFEEFVSVVAAEADEGRCVEEVRRAFTVYDRNGDGVISADELQYVMRRVMGERTTVAECRRMIRAVDKNGDGAISFEEFVDMMSGCFH